MNSQEQEYPKVTIAIPTLDRAHYLRLALNSALAQTYPSIEVVVSDNASKDDTSSYLASIKDDRVRVLRQDARLSMVDNWNACLNAAAGEYFILLSDDDLLEPTAISQMVAVFDGDNTQSSQIGFVYCHGRVINQDGKLVCEGSLAPEYESAQQIILEFFKSRRNLWPCAILFRRSDVIRYTQEFALGTDAAMWIVNAARYGGAHFVRQTLVNYRLHESLTFQTSYETWASENLRIAEFAIKEMAHAGREMDQWNKQVRQEAARLNVRVAAAFIDRRGKASKSEALKEYCRQLPQFASPYGVRILAKWLVLLFICPANRARIKRILKNLWRNRSAA